MTDYLEDDDDPGAAARFEATMEARQEQRRLEDAAAFADWQAKAAAEIRRIESPELELRRQIRAAEAEGDWQRSMRLKHDYTVTYMGFGGRPQPQAEPADSQRPLAPRWVPVGDDAA